MDAGFKQQDDAVKLLTLNSVCGCAAGTARPGVVLSLLNELVPDEYFSLFAGMEKEAVEYFRERYLPGVTPSSPNIVLIKNGLVLHMLQRQQVEGKTAGDIARELIIMYNKECSKRRPPEEMDELKGYISRRYNV